MLASPAIKGNWVPVTANQLAILNGNETTVAVKYHGWVDNAIRRGGKVYFTNQRGEKISMRCNDTLHILE